jgi:hypothetical protein
MDRANSEKKDRAKGANSGNNNKADFSKAGDWKTVAFTRETL